MIEGSRHKGLRLLFENDDRRKLAADDVDKIRRILFRLHVARVVEDVDAPGFRLHPLKGKSKGFWSVTVRANWRIISRFKDGHAYEVDMIDYH